MKTAILRRIARRCDIHDTASPLITLCPKARLDLTPSSEPATFTEALTDPDFIDCGRTCCRPKRGLR